MSVINAYSYSARRRGATPHRRKKFSINGLILTRKEQKRIEEDHRFELRDLTERTQFLFDPNEAHTQGSTLLKGILFRNQQRVIPFLDLNKNEQRD